MAEQSEGEDVDHWCPGGLHTVCRHLIPSFSDDSHGELRLEWDADGALCTCPCHAECPMTAMGTGAEWPAGCPCPGTVAHVRRESRASVSLGETLRASADKSRRKRQAQDELRRRAAGRSADEVDQMIDDVWSTHGLPALPGPARSWIVDHARNPPGYASQIRMTADLLAGGARFVSGIVGMIRDDPAPGSGNAGAEPTQFYVPTDADGVEVVLDPGTRELVGSLTDGMFTSRLMSSAKVTLRRAGQSVEAWTCDGTQVDGPVRFGTVPGQEAPRYLPLLRAAERVEEELVCPAIRTEGPDGEWHLYVRFPQTGPG